MLHLSSQPPTQKKQQKNHMLDTHIHKYKVVPVLAHGSV